MTYSEAMAARVLELEGEVRRWRQEAWTQKKRAELWTGRCRVLSASAAQHRRSLTNAAYYRRTKDAGFSVRVPS